MEVRKPKIRSSSSPSARITTAAHHGEEKISENEIARVKAYLEDQGMVGLSKIKNRILPKRSLASIYKIVLELNVPVDRPRIINYFCPRCELDISALHLYFGLTKKPPCPNCDETLKYKSSIPLSFIGDINSIYILCRGRLNTPRKDDYQLLDSFFSVPKEISFIGEIKYRAGQKDSFHVVKSMQNKTYTSQCGRAFIRAVAFTRDQNTLIKRGNICLKCSLVINNLLLRKKSLQPVIKHHSESKKERMMKIVLAGLALGNISAASKLFGISRTTIYKYRRKLGL